MKIELFAYKQRKFKFNKQRKSVKFIKQTEKCCKTIMWIGKKFNSCERV